MLIQSDLGGPGGNSQRGGTAWPLEARRPADKLPPALCRQAEGVTWGKDAEAALEPAKKGLLNWQVQAGAAQAPAASRAGADLVPVLPAEGALATPGMPGGPSRG